MITLGTASYDARRRVEINAQLMGDDLIMLRGIGTGANDRTHPRGLDER